MIISTANRLQSVTEYYFSHKLREIRQLQDKGMDIINIGIGSPDLAPSKATIQALTDTALQGNNHGYQSYTGVPALRQAMANFYADTYQVALDPVTEILPLMGSKEGIMHISMAFLNPGDTVLVPNPGYLTYSSVAKLVQAEAISYPLDEQNNWQPDWNYLENLDLEKVKIMWVNYPNMPTGADACPKIFKKLIAFAKKYKILIVNDNPYSLILNPSPKSIHQTRGASEVALELNSLSKSHNMAGWRVGMVTGRADYIQAILKVKSNMDSGMFLGIQKAAIQALQNPTSWHSTQNNIYRQRKTLAKTILQTLGCTISSNQVGLFVWAKTPDHIQNTKDWVNELLYKAQVFITPGFIFGSAGERYVRLSLCTSEARLQEALQRIQQFVGERQRGN